MSSRLQINLSRNAIMTFNFLQYISEPLKSCKKLHKNKISKEKCFFISFITVLKSYRPIYFFGKNKNKNIYLSSTVT
jgi:hypothetical protein